MRFPSGERPKAGVDAVTDASSPTPLALLPEGTFHYEKCVSPPFYKVETHTVIQKVVKLQGIFYFFRRGSKALGLSVTAIVSMRTGASGRDQTVRRCVPGVSAK